MSPVLVKTENFCSNGENLPPSNNRRQRFFGHVGKRLLTRHPKGRRRPSTDGLEPVSTRQQVQVSNQHGCCTVQTATYQSCASFDKQPVFTESLCLLSVGSAAPGGPRQLSCPWNVPTAPPRKVAVGFRGSGWTAGAGARRLPHGPWETPGPSAAGSARD